MSEKLINELLSISPIDGRYASKCGTLNAYFSEFALIKYRLHVEIEYFIELQSAIPELKNISITKIQKLRDLMENFSVEQALEIKNIERTTNHDVKAVEYFLKRKFTELNLEAYLEYIHFGLTSQDINNTAVPISLKQGLQETIFPWLEKVKDCLGSYSKEWQDIPMLARTHGQAASPTTLGKEIFVFFERLNLQFEHLKALEISGKFGGATGNFNAHLVVFPDIDWISFANRFLNEILGIRRQQTTTQIEHYDELAAIFHQLIRINNILIDLCRDIWTYVSLDYFSQNVVAGEVGSSAMPHKVNPIDFENAEGNLGLSNAMCEHLAAKLPISRLQRDLTDSTVLRNIGMPLAYHSIALQSILKGFSKLKLNKDKIHQDLDNNWVVLAEPIQSILRSINYPEPYEKLKSLTRGNNHITKEIFHEFVDSLDIDASLKNQMKALSPHNYTGYASKMVKI